jgi:hypothetical protein
MHCFFYIRNEKKKGRCLSLVLMLPFQPLVKLGIQKYLRETTGNKRIERIID